MEPIINSRIPEFKVQAFHNGEFITVTDKDTLGKWSVFSFIRLTLLSCALPSW